MTAGSRSVTEFRLGGGRPAVVPARRGGFIEMHDRQVRQLGLHRPGDRAAFGREGIEVDLVLEGCLEPGAPAREACAQLRAARQTAGLSGAPSQFQTPALQVFNTTCDVGHSHASAFMLS